MAFPHAAIDIARAPVGSARPTALYRAAASYGAAPFWTAINGWAARDIYGDPDTEITALQSGVGVCDFGIFARYRIDGPDAAELLQRLTTAPAGRLSVGQSAPGLLCDRHGFLVDLARVTRLRTETFALVCARPAPLRLKFAARGLNATYKDISEDAAAIAVFGPLAGALLIAADLGGGAEPSFAALVDEAAGASSADHAPTLISSARQLTAGGVDVTISPISVGAMKGVELVFAASEGLVMWERLFRRYPQAQPVGLRALELARLEGREPRVGADFISADAPDAAGSKRTPFDVGLAALAPIDSAWFNGRAALRTLEGSARKLTMVACASDAVRPGAAVRRNGAVVGRVTSCAYSPRQRETIAFVDSAEGPLDQEGAALALTIATDLRHAGGRSEADARPY